MSNLIAYGCSCTFGVSLPDIGDRQDVGPSKYAWPNVLSEKLELNCVNLGKGGSSNLEILNTILTTDFNDTDIIVVMWSFFDRDYIFKSDGTGIQFGSWAKHMLKLHWSLIHSSHDQRIRSWIYIYTAWLHLTKLKKKFYFGLTTNAQTDTSENFLNIRPSWADDVKFAVTDFLNLSSGIDLGQDNSHPGPKSHARLAEILFEHIKNDQRI